MTWESRANRLADELSAERRRTDRWINFCGVLVTLLGIAIGLIVAQALYG